MFAAVVPYRRLPAEFDYFDYAIPRELQSVIRPGSIVRIPFRNLHLLGVVTEVRKNSSVSRTKNIESLTPYRLTSQQFALLKWLKDFYHYSPSVLLPLFFPEFPKKLLGQSLEKSNKGSHKNISKTPRWFVYDRWPTLEKLLLQELGGSGQTVIIVPDERLMSWVKKLCDSRGLSALFIPKRIKKIPYFESWRSSQDAPLIVGSWQTLFWPFRNLRRVLILETDNPLYHQAEQNPRLHLNDYLWPMAQLYGAEITLFSLSPPIHMMQTSQKLKATVAQALSKESEVIRNLSSQPPFTISRQGLDDLAEVSGKALIFLNSLGAETGHKRWHDLLAQLHQEFPDKSIVSFGGDKKATQKELREADIVVATAKIFATNTMFDLAIILGADAYLGRPDYLAAEELRRHIYSLRLQSRYTIIETTKSEHPFWQLLQNYKNFYTQELAWRRQFDYPPFGSWYKFITYDQSSESHDMIQKLKSELSGSYSLNKDGKYELIVNKKLTSEFIDKSVKKYHNRLLVERNPYRL